MRLRPTRSSGCGVTLGGPWGKKKKKKIMEWFDLEGTLNTINTSAMGNDTFH